MKNKGLKFLILAVLILLPISALRAAGNHAGANIYVPESEIISGNFYATGQDITVDGNIGGDLIVAGQNIKVNGDVEGDIIAVGQSITIDGFIGGNVRVVGNSLTINGSVARNVNAFGTNVILGPNSNIGWDVYSVGSLVEARGIINGNLNGYAAQALITGTVEKDINLNLGESDDVSSLTISSTAVINGNLNYTSNNTANIATDAKINGTTEQKFPKIQENSWLMAWAWKTLFTMFSAFFIGLVLVFGLKNITDGILNGMEKTPAKKMLPGLIIMLITPPLAIILMLTLIGIPLAVILLALWMILLYVARIITALWIGKLIVSKIDKKSSSLMWPLVIGVLVLFLLTSIPILGAFICLIAVWLGLGAIYSYAYNQYKNI